MSATWRRLSFDDGTGSRLRAHAGAGTSAKQSGIRADGVRSHAAMSSSVSTSASEARTTARTTVTSTSSTAEINPVEIDPAVLLADSSSDQGVSWLLIALVLFVMTALGTGILRKSRAPRTV